MQPRLVATALLALVICLPGRATEVGTTLAAAVAAWLGTLDEDQRDDLLYAADDEERFDLRLAPLGLEGLRGEEMSEAQWQGWLDALGTTLSPAGRRKAELIMSLEREVSRLDQARFWQRWFGPLIRGERRYFASIYGTPGGDAPWGLRFDGHHLSLNWTEAGGELSVTPLFLGAQPREVPADWGRAGLRVLAEEEDGGTAVWSALDAGQRAAAELPFASPSGLGGRNRPLLRGEGARVEPAAPRGVAYRELDDAARAAVDALIETWLGNFAEGVAARHRAEIDAAGRGEIHFAFAGSLERGRPGYYRLQGPGFLIEFDDTAPGSDHVHALYRVFEGDFGRDLLADHYARAHAGRAIAHQGDASGAHGAEGLQ